MIAEKYSDNEKKLFTDVGLPHLMDLSIRPSSLYDLAMEKVFIDDQKGPHVEALRRAMFAIKACNPRRLTHEFEALITY